MEKVETLLRKLQEQFNEGDSAELLLVTAQKLQLELAYMRDKQAIEVSQPVSISANPVPPVIQKPLPSATYAIPDIEKKIIGILQIDEEEVAAELDEIKRNASLMQQISGQIKPKLIFESEEPDAPNQPRQEFQQQNQQYEQSLQMTEREVPSINDLLKEPKVEISEALSGGPIKDLKKAIGINDRFLFVNDLFGGDESAFDRSIKTINGFSIWPEAEYWIRRELKTKLGWRADSESVKQFDQLVRRRFS